MYHLQKDISLKTNLIKKALSTPIFLNTLKMSSSNVVMYLLPLLVTPILSRLYSPEDFGEWGVFSSFIAIVTLAIFVGLENAIVKVETEKLGNLIKVCIICSVSLVTVTTLIFLLGHERGWSFFCDFPYTQLLIAYFIAYIPYTIGYNLCNRFSKYTSLSLNNILQGGCQAFFRIVIALIGITTFNGLILGTTIALYISAFFLMFSVKTCKVRTEQEKFNITSIRQLIIEYKKFPLYDAPSSILSFAAFNLPTIILAEYFNKASIGCFSIILQLLLLPMSLIGSAMGKVYYQEICQEDDNSNNSNLTTITKKIFKVVTIISILPLLVLSCGGDKLIYLFLGNKWGTAGNVALCLALWSFPTILTQPLLPIFRYKTKQNILFFIDLSYFILGTGSILIGCILHWPLMTILVFFSLCCFFAKSLLFLKINKLGNVQLSFFYKYIPLWIIAIVVYAIRLFYL